MGKAKIIYTLEESADKADIWEGLVWGGMEIARLSFTSGEMEAYKRSSCQLKQLCNGMEIPLSILMDVKGTDQTKEKMRENILFGIEENVDYVTVSFVHSGEEAGNVRKFLNENGGAHIGLIVKITDGQKMNEMDAILEAADGVMVEHDPCILQREAMKKAYYARKMLITTTQMLDFRVGPS